MAFTVPVDRTARIGRSPSAGTVREQPPDERGVDVDLARRASSGSTP